MRIILKYNKIIFYTKWKMKSKSYKKVAEEKKKVSEPMNQFVSRYD
jgi:hypothetical protein